MRCTPQEVIALSERQKFLDYLPHLWSDSSLKMPLKLLTKELQSIDPPYSQISPPFRARDETLHAMDPSELQETTKLSLQRARKSIHELKEKNAELEQDMETHRSLLSSTETELREVNMKIQSLSKTLKARDEEGKGLVAKITILENARVDSAKDAERIRNLTLALEQGRQESNAIKNDMDIAQITIIKERQVKSHAETSVRALRAEIVILKAEIVELRRRATEELDPTGLGYEGQRSYVNAQIEELRELREVHDEQNATIKNQERELRKFEMLKMKLCYANMKPAEEEVEEDELECSKQYTKVSEEPCKIYASPSSSRSGSECGDLSLNLREQLEAFGEHYNSGSSVSSSPAMSEASGFSSPFKIDFATRDRRTSHATLSAIEREELYTSLGKEDRSPEEPQDCDSGDESPKRTGRHGRTESRETTSSTGDNNNEKRKNELSLVITPSSENEGSNICTEDEQPDSQRPARFDKDEILPEIIACPEQMVGQQLLSSTPENEEERLNDKVLLLPRFTTRVTGLGIFIRDESSPGASQHRCEDENQADVAQLERSVSPTTRFTHDEQIKCKDETSSPSTLALEDEDEEELPPILVAFNGSNKNQQRFLKSEERRKESTLSVEQKYAYYHDDKLSVLETWKFEDDKQLGIGTLDKELSPLTASKTCATISADQPTTLKHLQRQTISTQTDDTLFSEKRPGIHTPITTTTMSSASPCPGPALSSFRSCFYTLIHQHPFLSLLYLFFHCLFLILPFLYALTAGFAADRERQMWLSGSEVTRRAAVALGQGGWEGGYWDDFRDIISG
ncbi:hypothetical protein MMC31_005058 [Peltigera leucophlebia]|nr:hypothetical protein [Peltigera leucophlebia]